MLTLIDQWTKDRGYAPTVRDLAASFPAVEGDKPTLSTRQAEVDLQSLIKDELVVRTPGIARSIRLTDKGALRVEFNRLRAEAPDDT